MFKKEEFNIEFIHHSGIIQEAEEEGRAAEKPSNAASSSLNFESGEVTFSAGVPSTIGPCLMFSTEMAHISNSKQSLCSI